MRAGRRLAVLLLAVLLAGCGAGPKQPGNADTGGKKEQAGPEETDSGQSPEGGEALSAGCGMQSGDLLAVDSGKKSTGESEQTGDQEEKGDADSAGEADAVSSGIPNICVNRNGYITEGEKTAVFCGRELPEKFYVVREADRKTVFTGTLTDQGYRGDAREYTGYGDFSQVQERGVYYIEAPALGKSYCFEIGDSVYEDALQELTDRYLQRWGDKGVSGVELSTMEASREMALLLLAYELNGECLAADTGMAEDGNGIPDLLEGARQEAEWLLSMQDEESGGVCTGPVEEDARGESDPAGSSEPVCAQAFALALARFSYLYQDYDTEFATECLKAADRAWMYADLNGGGETDGWRFAAAAELYRASGRESFRSCVVEYLSGEDYGSGMEESIMLGCVTYLSTRQPVDLSLCEEITRELMARADQAARDIRQSPFPAGSGSGADGLEVLENGIYLSLVNHMVSSREYELVVEECLHWLMGRNRLSVNYLESGKEDADPSGNGEVGEIAGAACWQRAEDGKLILLLSEVLCWQRQHGSAQFLQDGGQ